MRILACSHAKAQPLVNRLKKTLAQQRLAESLCSLDDDGRRATRLHFAPRSGELAERSVSPDQIRGEQCTGARMPNGERLSCRFQISRETREFDGRLGAELAVESRDVRGALSNGVIRPAYLVERL